MARFLKHLEEFVVDVIVVAATLFAALALAAAVAIVSIRAME